MKLTKRWTITAIKRTRLNMNSSPSFQRLRTNEGLHQLMKEAEEESLAEYLCLEEKSGIAAIKLEKRLLRNAKTDYELNIEMEYTLSLHQPK